MDLINRNARALLQKKNKNSGIKLSDSIKLNDNNKIKKLNQEEGWTIEQEQNRLSLDDENEKSGSLYALNTQDLRGIKNESNNT